MNSENHQDIEHANLNNIRVVGVQNFGLTSEQVQAPNFGEQMLNHITLLMASNRIFNGQEGFQLLSGLDNTQGRGIAFYNLTPEQVSNPNFGNHTLIGINNLQYQNNQLSNGEAFDIVDGLDESQVIGIVNYYLNRREVQISNFGIHTLNGINTLQLQNPNLSDQQAFQIVHGLDDFQTRGLANFNLTREQVNTPNFGMHTLSGILSLQEQNQNLSNQQAFTMLSSLNQIQVSGIVAYSLTRANVQTANFGLHILRGIDKLILQNENISTEEAFNRVSELDYIQVRGVTNYNLNRAQVNTPNFGNHTLESMTNLNNQQRVDNWEEAFNMVRELNNRQTSGIIRFGLERGQVETPNFDMHTLFGIEFLYANALQRGVENYSFQDAFNIVEGLDPTQVRGITDFGLEREQVLHPDFGNKILKTIEKLQKSNPEANNQYLFDVAIKLPEYQIRALTKLGLSPEQIGLSLVGEQFIQVQHENERIASGSTVDAIDHLITNEYMDIQEAFENALQLDNTQIIAMIEYGLSLHQVQHESFHQTNNILYELILPMSYTNSELTFPLSNEEQESTREYMTSIISRSTSRDSFWGYSETSGEDSITNLTERETPQQLETGIGEITAIESYPAVASLPIDTEDNSGGIEMDLSALTRALTLNSIIERSIENSNGYLSDEERKPAAKKNTDTKKSSKNKPTP
ncbi:hypothetical protein [Ascidiimonas sp. W6]|uniref:hypothetical protein n=1 Tax=Ascidiimonas meishanensis TaxID=3128903 RepID=UPI0030EB503D